MKLKVHKRFYYITREKYSESMYHPALESTKNIWAKRSLANKSFGDLFATKSLAQKIVAAVDPFVDQIILNLNI